MQNRKALFRRWLPLVATAVALACVAAPSAPPAGAHDRVWHGPKPAEMAVGFDVGWIKGKYNHDLTSAFDPADWTRVFSRASAAGATVVRVWIMEGYPPEGILWDTGDPHLPIGVDPALTANIQAIAAIASDQGVKIYWTALDGNVPTNNTDQLDKDRLWNIYNGTWGMGDAYRNNVLGPVVDAIATRLDVAYGLDILNEVQGPLNNNYFSNGWDGARTFISQCATFVHARAPGLRCSSSAGYGSAYGDILDGRFDGLGLDWLDVHTYNDDGTVPQGAALAAHAAAESLPIILGEFGQISSNVDDALQSTVVHNMLRDTRRLGFAAVLCWRLEDEDPKYTFFNVDTPRPAYAEVKAFTGK